MIDIDGFHDINDTLGRAGGDTMLCNIAERLKSALPPGAMFGRFDDDGFAVVVASDDAQLATQLADSLSAALAAPIYLDQMWQISAGIGIAKAPEDGTTGDELQRHAALALRTAKRGGRGSVRHFVPEIHAEHAERRFFLRELETAIAAKRVRRSLSAGRRRRRRRHGRRRSAVALESSDARARLRRRCSFRSPKKAV